MKTQARIINKVILVLIPGMFVMTAAAQNLQQDVAGSKTAHTQNLPATPPDPGVLPLPPAPPCPPPPPTLERMDEHPQMLDLPDLTPDQLDKIKKCDLKHISEMTPLKNQVREKNARLSTILITMPVDQKQADQIADEIGKNAASILKALIRHDQELRSILTPDQQVIFDSRLKPWLRQREP
ncbi:MAG: periplasmic heavy metal sensor [Bacteroidetes bacterium]|nr:periplasmic heavy metal sensor [Bacteroidota bacterium]